MATANENCTYVHAFDDQKLDVIGERRSIQRPGTSEDCTIEINDMVKEFRKK